MTTSPDSQTIVPPADHAGSEVLSDPSDADAEPPPSSADDLVTLNARPGMLDDGDQTWILRQTLSAIDHLDCAVGQIAVRLLDDAAMTTLHRQHLDIDSTTDVLTFHHSDPDQPIAADIAIGIDVARRQADARRHSLRMELLLYIIHGLLHCAGFDDHTENEYTAMHAEEDRILTAIGVGVVFDRQTSPGRSA